MFGERFAGYREPAWHGLGKVFEDPISAVEAVEKADLGFEIIKAPLTAHIEGVNCLTGKYGIFREPTDDDPQYQYLGTASADYKIMQNKEIAQMLDPLTDKWPVETVGALGQGETMFMSLFAGGDTVANEDIKKFFLITDTRNGGTSMKILFTPVRVVCQNTLVSGLRQSIVSSSITHSMNMQQVLQARIDLIGKMQIAMEKSMASFEVLADAAIGEDGAQAVIDAAFPMPRKPRKMALLEQSLEDDELEEFGILFDQAKGARDNWLYQCERVEKYREGAMYNYDRLCDEHSHIAGTAWAAYNAVVEFADFRKGAKSVNSNALFGYRAGEKKKAFKKALELAVK
jgi:phage/plasmid-like protein (TIGR03299 family)